MVQPDLFLEIYRLLLELTDPLILLDQGICFLCTRGIVCTVKLENKRPFTIWKNI